MMPTRKLMLGAALLVLMVAACASAPKSEPESQIDVNKPYLEFKLTYNYDVYEKPSFFLPKSQPTFAIWLEEKESGTVQTIYVTGKAAEDSWILAEERPESVPVWYGVRQRQQTGHHIEVDALSGATPAGDTAVIQWQVPDRLHDKQVSIFIEANNSYDYNAFYSNQKGTAGYSGENGQPSLIWQAQLDFAKSGDEEIIPEIIGHGSLRGEDHNIYPDISQVTTARETFSYMGIRFSKGN
jgi:hypothetical protein